MGKTQKTVMLPAEVYRVIEVDERLTGAPFSRICLAAFVERYCSNENGPKRDWMHWAVAIEKGETTIEQAAVDYWNLQVQTWESFVEQHERGGAEKPLLDSLKRTLKKLREDRDWVVKRLTGPDGKLDPTKLAGK